MKTNLPPFLQSLLSAPPQAGEGVHRWLFCVARHLHAHMTAPDIVSLLESRVQGCGRSVPQREIVAAVQASLTCAWQPSGSAKPVQPLQSKWPMVNNTHRAAIIHDYGRLEDLQKRSIPPNPENARTEDIIDRLFPGNPFLCCGKTNSVFDTCPRESWRGKLASRQFLVPSPMLAVTGMTKTGRESKHTLANTGPRRFLICEFDTGTNDEHAALLLHLDTFAPLVCAVHSGNKSLHGWFFVHGQPEALIERFFCYAVSLGADSATWTRSQFVRMPNGTRDNGARQRVFYLNFKRLEANHE